MTRWNKQWVGMLCLLAAGALCITTLPLNHSGGRGAPVPEAHVSMEDELVRLRQQVREGEAAAKALRLAREGNLKGKQVDMEAIIQGRLKNVEPAYRTVCEDIMREKPNSFGQGYQDWFIYHNIYREREWGDGWYLDIGTNDATDISNTLFFDKCMGWKGICVEPNKNYHARIREHRSCQLVPSCVLGEAKKVLTSGDSALMSVKEHVAGDQNKNSDAVHNEVQCRGILDVLAELNPKPDAIDLANIDIEGAEGDVLKCFPFSEVKVGNWLVETNKQPQAAVDWFFHRHGYTATYTFGDSTNEGFKGYFLDTLYERRKKRVIVPQGAGARLEVRGGGKAPQVVKSAQPYSWAHWPTHRDGYELPSAMALGLREGNDWMSCPAKGLTLGKRVYPGKN